MIYRWRADSSEELAKDGLFGIKAAAAFLGVSPGTVRNLVNAEALPLVKIRGRSLIPRRALRDLVATRLEIARRGW